MSGDEAGLIIFAPEPSHKDWEILAYSARGVLRATWLVCSLLRWGPAARWGGVLKVGVVVLKVAPEHPPCIIAVWLVALRLGGVVFRRLHRNPHHIRYCAQSG